MFVNFFIKRPVFAIVCSIVIIIIGAVSILSLPVEQYPDINPVQINVSANYNGATAEEVESTVTNVLERQINGVEGMKYITSTSSNDGTSSITVTFKRGQNKDIAATDVQNRVSIVEAQLPEVVKQTGVAVTKQSNSSVLGMFLFGDGNQYDNIFISNYADLYIIDILKRLEGVGEVRVFGERRYAMRLWLDPNRLASRNLTAQDVVDALNEQNFQVSVGRIGQPPTNDEQMYQIDLRTQGRLRKSSKFEDIVLKTGVDGSLIKLKDVGRAELGAESYDLLAQYNGKEAVCLQIFQVPGSNALSIAKAVKAEMVRLAQDFPPGMTYEIPYDPTLFVIESRNEVLKALVEAIILVILVIFVFLQDWRSTIIPMIAIPVSLIGTLALIQVFKFSINSLTLFGLTLASGLVVDDAIIVVENITRLMQNRKLNSRQAASEAMREVMGAVIATSLVLMAVFIPVAFFPGTTGQLYKQFALTIAFSITISTFSVLTLTPALSALLLRHQDKLPQNSYFDRVSQFIDSIPQVYRKILIYITRFKGVVMLLYIASLGLTYWLYLCMPTAFLPDEDQGYFITLVQGPQGTSLNYTKQVITQVEKELRSIPEVAGVFSLGGFSFSGNTANNGVVFTLLKPWSERTKPDQSANAIIDKVNKPLSQILEATVITINPPVIQGLGNIGGFQFQLQDQGGNDLNTFVQVRDELVKQGKQNPQLGSIFSIFTANTPQLLTEVDNDKAKALQVSVKDIYNTLEIFLGSRYVNDFNLFQRPYRVYVQADKQFRSNPQDINSLYVRSKQGRMISLNNLVKIIPTTGAQTINHYNLFRSIEVNGTAAPGYSSGRAIQVMEKIAKQVLPHRISYEWSGISLEELTSGGQAALIFSLGVVFVFLVLAAQYENFIDPLIIILSVPLAILGALCAQSLRGFSIDVYCQIGLILLIGLASKNAILIVEFANKLQSEGLSITKAAIGAAELRLRPILMTTLTFMLSLMPMVMATGAGSFGRRSLGTSVCGGVIVSTLLSLFMVPVLYIVIGTAHKCLQNRLNKLKKN